MSKIFLDLLKNSLFLQCSAGRPFRCRPEPGGAGPSPRCKKPFLNNDFDMKQLVSFRVLALCGLLLLLPLSALAQRQTSGRPSLDLYGTLNLDQGVKFAGGGFSWCNYDFRGRTVIGIDVYREYHGYTEAAVVSNGEIVAPEVTHDFMATDACGSVGYMFRLLAPRSRWIILSAGGHLLAGVKYVPEMKQFKKSNTGKNYSAVGFYLGLVPDVQVEVFPFKNVSLFAGFRPRARLVSGMGGFDREWYSLSVVSGLKIYM